MVRTPCVVTKIPANAKVSCLKKIDLVAEHDEISRRRGSVLFGRIGRGLAKEKVSMVRDAIDTGKKPMFYLIRKNASEYEFFKSEIVGIWGEGYTPDISRCPAYYRELYDAITLWIEIRGFEKIEKEGLSSLRLTSTGRPIIELLRTQASLMLADSIS